jgi:large subunit ribosomal protein L4
VTFGPSPRDHSYRVNKKVKKAALRSALSCKLQENKLLVVDSLNLPEIKTKAFVAILKHLAIDSACIIDRENSTLEKSAHNVPFVKVLRPEGINVYDILRYDTLVITKACVETVTRSLSS